MDALNEVALAPPPEVEGAAELARARREVAAETRATLAELIPDFEGRSNAHLDRYKDVFEKLKGSGGLPERYDPARDWGAIMKYGEWAELEKKFPHYIGATQPAHAGELWWAQTDWFMTAPANTLSVDINAGDRYRIWGHIGYGGDNLMNGTVGLVMTFMLTPDRYPFTTKTTFEVRPELRTGGWVSGWTGQYHPIWHADDKWSKCWRLFRADLTLSTGEGLSASVLHDNQFFLEDENPVGQANTSQFMGWGPLLRFNADLADLRARGVSMIFRAELRFDFQLEGESDIWFRNRTGSQSESVPSFDNAVTFRCWPGSIVPV